MTWNMNKTDLSKWNGAVVKFTTNAIEDYWLYGTRNWLDCIGISFVEKYDIIKSDTENFVNVVFFDPSQKTMYHFRFKTIYLERSEQEVPRLLKEEIIEKVNQYHHGDYRFIDNLSFAEFMSNVKKIQVKG